MPKKKKCGKNTKSKGSNIEKRKLIEADLDGQVYGIIEKALGDRFFTVNCLDNTIRRCRVRSKRMRIKTGECVIIALRDFDEFNADIIYRYDADETRQLQRMCVIPGADIIGAFDKDTTEPEDDGFIFEDI